MKLIINGENKEFSDDFSLQDIITNLKIEDKVMAAAVNMEIVKKDDWSSFIPKDEDKIDIRPFISEQKYIPKEGDKIVALQPPKMSVLKESYLQNESEAVS